MGRSKSMSGGLSISKSSAMATDGVGAVVITTNKCATTDIFVNSGAILVDIDVVDGLVKTTIQVDEQANS